MDGSPHGRHRSPAPLIVAALACLLIPPQTVASPHKTKTAVSLGNADAGRGVLPPDLRRPETLRLKSDRAREKAIRDGHTGTGMFPTTTLTNQELIDTVSYLETLGKEDQDARGGETATSLSGDSRRGEGLYQASCVVCHGSRANGGVGPKLAGNPVLSNDQAFWKVVHEGRHVMPPLKDVISDQQFADIRAWLRTLP